MVRQQLDSEDPNRGERVGPAEEHRSTGRNPETKKTCEKSMIRKQRTAFAQASG